MKKSIVLLIATLCLAITSCSKKCGENAYDQKTQFCHNESRVVDKCSGEAYNPDTQFCHTDGKTYSCNNQPYNPDTQFCHDNSMVANKCSGEVYNPDMQFCHNDGKTYSCKDQPYNPDTQFCHDNSMVADKCGNEVYNPSNRFCDTRDNKIYKSVKRGDKVWMAQNLNFDAPDSKCYGNKPANCNKYGRLYNWDTAMKACPSGWHLPSAAEWQSHNPYESSFAALPGGSGGNSFNFIGEYGYWWGASENSAGNAWYLFMFYEGGLDCDDDEDCNNINYSSKSSLYSVRCVKD